MRRGRFAILLMFAFAAFLTGSAIWYHYQRSRRAIELSGAAHADRISQSPIATVVPFALPQNDAALPRDVTQARGFSNIRRSLTEDISFAWDEPAPLDAPAWAYEMRFVGTDGSESRLLYASSACLVKLQETGASAVVRPEFAKVLDEFFAEQFASPQ